MHRPINPLAQFKTPADTTVLTSYRIRNPRNKQTTPPLTPKSFRFVLSQVTTIATGDRIYVTDAMIDALFPVDGDYPYMNYIVRREPALTLDQILEKLMVEEAG